MVDVGRSSCLFAEKSHDCRRSHTASFVAFDVAMYSASMVDRVVNL